MIREEKKRVRLIHNKVLVSGPPEALLPHEILVREDPNSNKVSLQEIDSNGNLSIISTSEESNEGSNGGSNAEDVKYNYIKLHQYFETLQYKFINDSGEHQIEIPEGGIIGIPFTIQNGKYITVLPQKGLGIYLLLNKHLSLLWRRRESGSGAIKEIREVDRIETKAFSANLKDLNPPYPPEYPYCPIIIIEIKDPIKPGPDHRSDYSKCKVYPADPDKDYYISDLRCTVRYDSKTKDLIVNPKLPIKKGVLPIKRCEYRTSYKGLYDVTHWTDVHIISRKAHKLKSNK